MFVTVVGKLSFGFILENHTNAAPDYA